MNIIAFLLLIAPGILTWKISDEGREERSTSGLRTLLTILLDDILILVASYVILYIVYGRIIVSFDARYYENIATSLFSVSFVWKYGIVVLACGAGLGVVKLLLGKWRNRGKGMK